MKDKVISTVIPISPRSSIESRLDDINLILNGCIPFAAMIGIKNLSSDLRAEVDTRKRISHEEYTNYMSRIDKMIWEAEKTCICRKRKWQENHGNKLKRIMAEIPYSNKILWLDNFAEILEAVDDKVHKEPDNVKLKKIQGALYEVLTKAYEYDMLYKKEDALFPYETLINIEVIINQHTHKWTDEMRNRLV